MHYLFLPLDRDAPTTCLPLSRCARFSGSTATATAASRCTIYSSLLSSLSLSAMKKGHKVLNLLSPSLSSLDFSPFFSLSEEKFVRTRRAVLLPTCLLPTSPFHKMLIEWTTKNSSSSSSDTNHAQICGEARAVGSSISPPRAPHEAWPSPQARLPKRNATKKPTHLERILVLRRLVRDDSHSPETSLAKQLPRPDDARGAIKKRRKNFDFVIC